MTGPQPLSAKSSQSLRGRVLVPGDKSVSHRSLIFGALAVGRSTVRGLLEAEDVMATAAALRAMGARMERAEGRGWTIDGVGVGGLLQPDGPLDLGNSGTSARLLLGLVAGHDIEAEFVGDASLSRRPMARVLDPLGQMGAQVVRGGPTFPLTLQGARDPVPLTYRLPVPSAQVKSAVLLAGLNTPGITTVIESEPTRDHTERMLKRAGAELTVATDDDGAHRISLSGQPDLQPMDIDVPGDPSSAAFIIVAALIVPGSDVVIENVMMNPTRIGLIATLREMGGSIEALDERDAGGEIVADLRVRAGSLHGVEVPAERAPTMIDEYPVLGVAAAHAQGTTHMTGLGELRVKESDRLAAMEDILASNGVSVRTGPDSITVSGGPVAGGAEIDTRLDHRIAMASLVLGLSAQAPVSINDAAPIRTSYVSFVDDMRALGGDIVELEPAA